MPLSAERKIQLEKGREQKVQDQLADLKTLIDLHKDDSQKLHNAINNDLKSYKPDALELAYNYMRENDYPAASTLAFGKLSHTRMIGRVKENRSLKYEGKKQDGITEGGRWKKNSPGTLKGEKTILIKKGSIEAGSEGEEVCEYYGSSLAMAMMGSKLSPKFRLHSHGNKKYVASTFIKGFKTFNDGASKYGAKGFGRFLARIIIGNYDVHEGNAGVTEINGEHYWTAIDDGRAMSYNVDRNWRANAIIPLKQPQNLQYFISRMQEIRSKGELLYRPALFEGAQFACDLNAASKDVDIEIMRHILKESTKNLKELYGDNFLSQPNIRNELCKRMGLKPPLTEQLVEDTIIANIEKRKKELQAMASKEAQKALEEAIDINNINDIQLIAQHMPESIKAFIEVNPTHSHLERINVVIKLFIKENIDNKKVLKNLYAHMPSAIEKNAKSFIETSDIKSLKKLKTALPDVSIEGKSPLKYAISAGKIDIAIKMVKAGFTIRDDEINRINVTHIAIRGANYFWSRNGTQNDKLRIAIIGNNSGINPEILKTKPSLLYLAIETKQTDLAIELLNKGYKLKSSELSSYNAKEQVQSIKLSVMGKYFGWYNEEDKKALHQFTNNLIGAQIEAQKQNAAVSSGQSGTWRGTGRKGNQIGH